MNALIAWLKDWWERWFEFSCVKPEQSPPGGTPAVHDFRKCPKCDAFQPVVSKTRLVSGVCGHTIADYAPQRGLAYDGGGTRSDHTRFFILGKPLHNPYTSWALVATVVSVGILLTLFTPHFTGNVVPVSMTAQEWLAGALQYDFPTFLTSFAVAVVYATIGFAGIALMSRFVSRIKSPRAFALGMVLWLGLTGLATITIGIARPTHLFSAPYVVLSDEQVVGHFRPKVDDEVERLFDAQKYDEALEVVNLATKKIPHPLPSWWALQSKIAERAFAENSFVLEKPAFREALEKAGPDGDVALAFPERYRVYLLAKDDAGDKVVVYDHCHRDPWGYITATSIDRFAKVIEFCKAQP